ncbi:hypothetical protein RB195_009734 [Necator americanus]|uniref:MIP18 family-like domain-containing protein n=1 Tax=Necator americanus TaxID=51031 RepID=A0ABR1CVG0_NECAM
MGDASKSFTRLLAATLHRGASKEAVYAIAHVLHAVLTLLYQREPRLSKCEGHASTPEFLAPPLSFGWKGNADHIQSVDLWNQHTFHGQALLASCNSHQPNDDFLKAATCNNLQQANGQEELIHAFKDNKHTYVDVRFTPTIPHCAMATLIGLAIRVKLVRSLHPKIKAVPMRISGLRYRLSWI